MALLNRSMSSRSGEPYTSSSLSSRISMVLLGTNTRNRYSCRLPFSGLDRTEGHVVHQEQEQQQQRLQREQEASNTSTKQYDNNRGLQQLQ